MRKKTRWSQGAMVPMEKVMIQTLLLLPPLLLKSKGMKRVVSQTQATHHPDQRLAAAARPSLHPDAHRRNQHARAATLQEYLRNEPAPTAQTPRATPAAPER
jgi:hypothetical protein